MPPLHSWTVIPALRCAFYHTCQCPFPFWRTGVWYLKARVSPFSSSDISWRSIFSSCGLQTEESDRQNSKEGTLIPDYMSISDSIESVECMDFCKDMVIHEDFLSEGEERTLFNEVEPHVERLPYEFDHWDDAIHGFRETERLQWTEPSTLILNRVRSIAFPPGKQQLKHVHVLDLSENGFIKPHIDSVRFCGDTIAGLSLLSDSVMRLVHDKDKRKNVDVLLKRRSLYVMRNSARYDYTHEVLSKECSKFKGKVIPRGRRISVICRSEVPPE